MAGSLRQCTSIYVICVIRESSSPAPLIIQEQYTMTRSTNSPTLVLEIVAMVFHKLKNGADTNCETNQKIVGMVGNRTPHLQLSRLLL